LKRTQPRKQVYKEPSSEPSPALLSLLGRMAAREWRDEQLTRTLEYLKESASEIKFIRHLRECKECQLEATLSIERYGGRGLPWFFDLINDPFECGDDVGEDSIWKDCPRVQDYRIGSYWDRSTDHNETGKFITDRLNWAEKIIRQQIWDAAAYYKLLKEWDLSGESPTEPQLLY